MTKKILAMLVATCLASPAAWSGTLIEPFVAYGLGSGEESGASADYSGGLYGAKLGYQFLGLNGGFRFDRGSLEAEYSNGTVDSTHTAYGAFVGYDFPILFNASFAYYFSSEQEIDFATRSATLEGSGMSFHFGLGFAALANVFFEYHQHNYDNAAEDSATWYFFGVSLPLNL